MSYQYRKPSSNTNTLISKLITVNSKGHLTVGYLRPSSKKKTTTNDTQTQVNHFLEKCVSFETAANTFCEMVNIINYIISRGKRSTSQMEEWTEEVYKKLYNYVNRKMQISFDDIDTLLLVCNVLIENKMIYRIEEFILNCPKKFIVAYSNNPDKTPIVLHELDKLGIRNIRAYLISHIHDSKFITYTN